MKRATLILVALAGAAFFAGEAAAIALLGSYATPGAQPRGYAFSDLYDGWLVDDGGTARVYHVHWTTGSVSASFAAPGGRGAWGLCSASGRYLYLSNNRTSYIYRVTTTGAVMGSCRCPLDGPADMTWAYAGNYAYVAIPGRNVIAAVDADTGSLIRTYAGPGKSATSCAGYSGAYVGDADTHTVYLNGKPLITDIASPLGLEEVSTWLDATYLYVVDDATDQMYMYVSGMPVGPASLGRVKALFR
jgi:DNA-binding beta-propeller fold protein YncE